MKNPKSQVVPQGPLKYCYLWSAELPRKSSWLKQVLPSYDDFAQAWVADLERCWEGRRPTRDAVLVPYPLINAAQADQGKKVDLLQEHRDLQLIPLVAEIASEMTAAEPDWDLIKVLSAPLRGVLNVERDGLTASIKLWFKDGYDWPESLGGEWGDELARSITIHCRYAKWRDRRQRRLWRVDVHAYYPTYS